MILALRDRYRDLFSELNDVERSFNVVQLTEQVPLAIPQRENHSVLAEPSSRWTVA